MGGSKDTDRNLPVAAQIIIRPEAEGEIQEAYAWYEGRSAGLGAEFLHAVDVCLDTIFCHPEAFPAVHWHIRRALLRRFPYSIFYLIESQRIVVLACFHASRDPKGWQRRAQ